MQGPRRGFHPEEDDAPLGEGQPEKGASNFSIRSRDVDDEAKPRCTFSLSAWQRALPACLWIPLRHGKNGAPRPYFAQTFRPDHLRPSAVDQRCAQIHVGEQVSGHGTCLLHRVPRRLTVSRVTSKVRPPTELQRASRSARKMRLLY